MKMKRKKKYSKMNQFKQIKKLSPKKNQLNSKNQALLKIKNQYEAEKKNINDAIDHFRSVSNSNSSNKKRK